MSIFMSGKKGAATVDEQQHIETYSESTVTLKWGIIIVLVLGFFGWLSLGTLSHENRLTKVETKLEIQIPQMSQTLENLTRITQDIRDDQVRRQHKELLKK